MAKYFAIATMIASVACMIAGLWISAIVFAAMGVWLAAVA